MNNLHTYIQKNICTISNANFSIETQKKESYSPEISKKTEFRVNTFLGIKKSKVQDLIPVEEILRTIKNGDSHLSLIEKARKIGKGNDGYVYIKTYKLPTCRFNFQYRDKAVNKNIICSTGLIYIDVDGADTVPDSEYVFAKWKSLSNTGFGILVKVENLTQTNFEETYNQLSEVIGIKSDPGARSPNQQNVLSYDSNLYYNPNSITYTCIEKEEIKKVSYSNIIKEKERISSNDTFFKNEDNASYRDNNIDEYFKGEFADVPFLVFPDEKTKICQPFPAFKTIEEGQRNWRMLSYLSMHAILNLNCDKEYLLLKSYDMNYWMRPMLPKHEVSSIITNVLKKRKEGSLEMYFNKEKRILFNPKFKFSREEKRQITGREMGNIRSDKTSQLIYDTIESWDFEANGKITGEKVAELSKKSLTTIKRYWSKFKDYVKDLNTSNKHDLKLS
nr:hypothetical protein [uncultured Flavobacterium sp.]